VIVDRRSSSRCLLWVKNGRDALEMGCLFYPRKQTSVSYAADADVIVCYGRAKLTDKHLASKIHCVDDEIIEWLQRRERRYHQFPKAAQLHGLAFCRWLPTCNVGWSS
jgi:hypothetical protein